MTDMYLELQKRTVINNNPIPIVSSCDGDCLFCSNKYQPNFIQTGPPRSIESTREGLKYLNPDFPYIDLNCNYFGDVFDGDANIHPQLFEILAMIREEGWDQIFFMTTIGKRFKKSHLDRLLEFKPLEIAFSYHSHNPKYWSHLTGTPEKYYTRVVKAMEYLNNHDVPVAGIMTPMPSFTGYLDFEDTIAFLSKHVFEININYTTWTKYTPERLRPMFAVDWPRLQEIVAECRSIFDLEIKFESLADDRELKFYPEVVMGISERNYKNVVWALSEGGVIMGAGKKIDELKGNFKNNHRWVNVKSKALGGNVISSGLLQVSDYLDALKDEKEVDLVLLPQSPFDKYGNDVIGVSHKEIENLLSCDSWIIPNREELDSVYRIWEMPLSQRIKHKQTYRDIFSRVAYESEFYEHRKLTINKPFYTLP